MTASVEARSQVEPNGTAAGIAEMREEPVELPRAKYIRGLVDNAFRSGLPDKWLDVVTAALSRQDLKHSDRLAAVTQAVDAARALAGPRVLPSPAEHTLALIGAPPDVHVPTGIDTLDAITEGGFLSGRFHVIAGEPNLGKTSLAVQMARYACEEGFAVGFHVADVDDRRGIILRIAQAYGLDRRAFIAHDETTLIHAAQILARWPDFFIVDEAADRWTVDETAEALLAHAATAGRRPVLFVDSLQTVRLRWADEPRTDKDRIDRVVRTLTSFTRRGLLVVATCEVPRSVYSGPKRSRGMSPAPPALAAFKGSGNIEYALWTGLVLTRIQGESDAVRVEVPKNKQGREGVTFKLERTASRVGYEDAGEMTEAAERGEPEERQASMATPGPNVPPRVDQARQILMRRSPIGRETWIVEVGGKKEVARTAVRWLVEKGEALAERGPDKTTFYRWNGSSPPVEEA
jgi:KaiC/GvpD/RAD55 family RecA-like ATPase